VEEECIRRVYEAEQDAKVEAVRKAGEARVKQIRKMGNREMGCVKGVYEAEGKARREESKASLKELKLTKEHERKCIGRMWKAEEDTRVECLRVESQLRMELMREERGDVVAREEQEVQRGPSRAAKRKRVL